MDRKLARFGAALGIAVFFAVIAAIPAVDRATEVDIDLLHVLHDASPFATGARHASPTAVIAIDEETYASAPFAGLPRVMWTPQLAAVQDAVLDGGANVVGWDVVLPTSAATYVADRNFDRPLLQSLSRAGKTNRIVLGATQLGKNTIEPHRLFLYTAGGTRNLRPLNVSPSPDGVVRSVPTFVRVKRGDGETSRVAGLSVELAARHLKSTARRTDNGGVELGGKPVRHVLDDRLIVNFSHTTSAIPTYSLADLWHCSEQGNPDFFREHFSGKTVLIGLVLDVEDRKLASNRLVTDGSPPEPVTRCTEKENPGDAATAHRATIPGVYVLATAANNLIAGNALLRFGGATNALLSLPLALTGAFATLCLGPFLAAAACLAAILAWLAIATYGFSLDLVVPLLAPALACVGAYISVLALRFVVLDRQGRFLRRAFSSYVAPDLVEELVRNPDKLALSGERRDMSFLFTDIAGFTGLVEGSDPTRIVAILNRYLDRMIDIAQKHGGTVDKVIGDALVVIFSAPLERENHANQAVAAAVEMDSAAEAFRRQQEADGVRFGETRIGVHSGNAVVGNIGGSGFFDYTAIGDAMNTAARLESANKQWGTRVAVSGETARRATGFRGRPIGRVVFQGKTEPIEVFSPCTDPGGDLASGYAEAYAMLDADPQEAKRAFAALFKAYPDDPLARLHCERSANGDSGTLIVLTGK